MPSYADDHPEYGRFSAVFKNAEVRKALDAYRIQCILLRACVKVVAMRLVLELVGEIVEIDAMEAQIESDAELKRQYLERQSQIWKHLSRPPCGHIVDLITKLLSKPLPVTKDEIAEEIEANYFQYQLMDTDEEDLEAGINEINSWICKWCEDNRISPEFLVAFADDSFELGRAMKPFCQLDRLTGSFVALKRTEKQFWDLDHVDGIVLRKRKSPRKLYAVLQGHFSAAALKEAAIEFRRVTRAVFRVVCTLDGPSSTDESSLPKVSNQCLERYADLIQRLVQIYYAPSPSKKSVDKRIQSALRLMIEADHQKSDAVALTLSTAALEALVGRNVGGAVTHVLAQNIATILEEPSERYSAIKFVKQIYDQRSNVVHGNSTEVPAEIRGQVRLLAASLLAEILQWRDFSLRVEGETTQERFFIELEAAFASGKPFGVAGESPARKLWRER